MPAFATADQVIVAPFGCWNEATSTPWAAPLTGPAVAAASGLLMTGPLVPDGPASCCSSFGEWVLPTL
jgi:hypothetical protein